MIENNRDEEVCRRWDVLADEDHTDHLSEEEYIHYKNKWWFHLNKSGSDTLPLRKRSDFKEALSTLETFTPRSWRRTNRAHSLLEEKTMEVGIEFRPLLGGNGKTPCGPLKKFRKSRKRQAKSWEISG